MGMNEALHLEPGTQMLTLQALNHASQAQFVAMVEGVYEHAPWIAELAWHQRPFASTAALKLALTQVVREAERARQLELVRSHTALAFALTGESATEQDRTGLTQCT